jgi:TATA-box binding protein (TBP) (component of TFIID and TFIIIB)
VASFRFGEWFSPLQYRWLSENGINTEFSPRKFHSIRMRLRTPAQTVSALIFRNGKVVLCGSKSEEAARKAAFRVCRRVNFALVRGATACNYVHQHRHSPCRVLKLEIHNVVGSMTMGRPIKLQKLHEKISSGCIFSFTRSRYSPSIFPAVRFKACFSETQSTQFSISVFSNGKIIITGAKCSKHIHICSEHVFIILTPFLY